MINPEDFPHVEEAFICLKRTNRAEIESLRFELHSIDNEIHRLTNKLAISQRRPSSRELSRLRNTRLECLGKLKKLDTQPTESVSWIDYDEAFREEFRKICIIPEVIGAGTYGPSEPFLTLHATCEFEGERYFIGDWVLSIKEDPKEPFWLSPENTGRRNDWTFGDYPDYSWVPNSSDGYVTFCTGSNSGILETLFNTSRYLQGVQLAAHVLRTINDNHAERQNIPNAFVKER